jgi:hypothetical protein
MQNIFKNILSPPPAGYPISTSKPLTGYETEAIMKKSPLKKK